MTFFLSALNVCFCSTFTMAAIVALVTVNETEDQGRLQFSWLKPQIWTPVKESGPREEISSFISQLTAGHTYMTLTTSKCHKMAPQSLKKIAYYTFNISVTTKPDGRRGSKLFLLMLICVYFFLSDDENFSGKYFHLVRSSLCFMLAEVNHQISL